MYISKSEPGRCIAYETGNLGPDPIITTELGGNICHWQNPDTLGAPRRSDLYCFGSSLMSGPASTCQVRLAKFQFRLSHQTKWQHDTPANWILIVLLLKRRTLYDTGQIFDGVDIIVAFSVIIWVIVFNWDVHAIFEGSLCLFASEWSVKCHCEYRILWHTFLLSDYILYPATSRSDYYETQPNIVHNFEYIYMIYVEQDVIFSFCI